ncbi:MAG: KamA family radical SAM protein [Desulfobacteraceae bacterium]|nr:KamA family radical SAM protein [Desulfobacteraceae bacterium]
MRNPKRFQPSSRKEPAHRLTQCLEEEEPPDLAPGPAQRKKRGPAGSEPSYPPLRVVRPRRDRETRTTHQTFQFRRSFYPGIPDKCWNDWQWQVQNRIRTISQLQRMLQLTAEEIRALEGSETTLPVAVTPYYMSLLSPENSGQALRRTVIPVIDEAIRSAGESEDPLGEEHQSPVPGLVHRYPDRVLLLVLDFCSTYCRYCTRSRVVGRGALFPSRSRLELAFDYIRSHPEIRDVLLSGGDPLTLGDNRLEWILSRLRQIPTVEIIRIGTKIPAVLPQRVTARLTRMLRKYHPLWMSLHFTHPEECTPEAARACAALADSGIPLGSQTVLLRGINDNLEVMKELVHRLLRMRVRPYYLYQCDPILGSAHFRTPVDKGLEIIRGLRGFTSGYAVPTFVVDAPGGGGKVPVMPQTIAGREGMDLLLRNYEDRCFRYPEVVP